MASKEKRPPRAQSSQPGREHAMRPEPLVIREDYRGSEKLKNRIALVSGGDSGIGRSVALHFAREGADVAIIYLSEDKDAEDTKALIEKEGRRCLPIKGDCGIAEHCQRAVKQLIENWGRLDILVNNAGEQHTASDLTEISEDQLRRTFNTNIFGYFFLTQAALPQLREGAAIVNTSSVTAFRGSKHLMDYAATKGAIQAFTFSLAQALAPRKIRVNGVAPGPIWTPLIPSTFSPEEVEHFGEKTLMNRPGEPAEVGPAYVFLASQDASYITGQFLHINGGEYISA